MRLWLKDSERKPDPKPLTTNDRTPVLIGLAAWLVGLVAVLVGGAPAGSPALNLCLAGLGLGVLLFGYTTVFARRRR